MKATHGVLRSAQRMIGFRAKTTDAEIGQVEDLLFTHDGWSIRFLSINTAGALNRRSVFLPPRAVIGMSAEAREVYFSIDSRRASRLPGLRDAASLASPIRRGERTYFRWPYFWTGAGVLGIERTGDLPVDMEQSSEGALLHSVNRVSGFQVFTRDGKAGEVDDFLFDEAWQLAYISVVLRRWWPTKAVLIPLEKIGGFNWAADEVFLTLGKDQLRGAPVFDRTATGVEVWQNLAAG